MNQKDMPRGFDRNRIKFDFRVLKDLNTLKLFIGVDNITESFINTKHEVHRWFIQHRIPKKNTTSHDKYRIVWQPINGAERLYKTLNRRFEIFIRDIDRRYPHPCSYGYVRGRNTLDNAKLHIGASVILHADISNFFHSIKIDRIKKLFISYGIDATIANYLSEIVTLNGSLPLGVHTSPMLANVCCLDLDDKLYKLSQRYSCAYSRYADDISISGSDLPSKDEVEMIFSEEGFVLSQNKFSISKLGQKHFVTGLSVSDPLTPHVPRQIKKSLRQELYYCNKFGVIGHLERIYDGSFDFIQKNINRIDGFVRYVSFIERKPNFKADWMAMLSQENLRINYRNKSNEQSNECVIYIDETKFEFNGASYLAIALVQTSNFDLIESESRRIYEEYIADPFAAGRKDNIAKNKIHFTDVHPDLQGRYIDWLYGIAFDAYIAFCKEESANYQSLYLSLLSRILPDRLRHLRNHNVKLILEQNPEVSSESIKNKVFGIDNYLKLQQIRSAKTSVIVGSKQEYYGFSVPDFVLGLSARYAISNSGKQQNDSSNPPARDTLLFEKMRDKIRVVYDVDAKRKYTRHRPFVPFQ
ncbi:MAG: RNA-directed DNA polymerase [Magnetococcales bacterium]|nr:RNA-directed DNA polymerase [Magnetococcales bacterium]